MIRTLYFRNVFLTAWLLALCLSPLVGTIVPARADDKPAWLLGHAYKVPSEYTNQESGYFSIVEGHNGRVYIGAAKYGVDAYLLEFDPKTGTTKMVLDAH